MVDGIDPRQDDRLSRADERLDALVEDMQAQPLADQTRRDAVEHPPDLDSAGGGDRYDLFAVVGGAPRRQRLEPPALDGQGLAATAVEAPDQGVEPLTVVVDGGEIGRLPQQ